MPVGPSQNNADAMSEEEIDIYIGLSQNEDEEINNNIIRELASRIVRQLNEEHGEGNAPDSEYPDLVAALQHFLAENQQAQVDPSATELAHILSHMELTVDAEADVLRLMSQSDEMLAGNPQAATHNENSEVQTVLQVERVSTSYCSECNQLCEHVEQLRVDVDVQEPEN